MKKIGLFFMCCITLMVFSDHHNYCCASNNDELPIATKAKETIIPPIADQTASENTITIAQPKIIDFGSKNCRACKAMEPILESCMVKHSDKFITEFIDVWKPENQSIAKAHKIQSIPTQIFFDEKGKELFRHTGFISENDILAKWRKLGFIFKTKIGEKEPK